MQGPVVDDDTANMVRKQGNLHSSLISSLKPSSFVFSFYLYTESISILFWFNMCFMKM